jgi:murein DD-endopeptidase MepM/ murein hydrolase activator NlpD
MLATKEKEITPTLQSFQEDGVFHIVAANETLSHICQVYGLDLKRVAGINKLTPPYSLKKGETVFLPFDSVTDEPLISPVIADSKLDKESGKKNRSKKKPRSLAKLVRGKRNRSVPRLCFPVPGGALTSPFGHRWGKFHKGLDIAAAVGSDVLACHDGVVVFTGSRKRFRRYGKTVLIDHGKGVYTYYAHLNKILCKRGQKIKKGAKIAEVGNTGRSTGPHLHLEVRVSNNLYNPIAYFAKRELDNMRIAKRFTDSPMGPVRARWKVPDLLTAGR